MGRRSYYCKLCDHVATTTSNFTDHIEDVHQMDILDYYVKYDIDNIPFRLRRQLHTRDMYEVHIEQQEEIAYDNIVDQDYVSCPVCGGHYKQLPRHTKSAHGLSRSDLESQFPNSKLSSYSSEKLRGSIMTRTLNEMWECDEYRMKQSEELKLRSKDPSDPLVINKIANGGKKRFPYKSSVSGSIHSMRSSWEVDVAKYLDDNKIEYEYEPFAIEYDSGLYYPDFFIPSKNLVIEVKPHSLTTCEDVVNKRQAILDKGYKFVFITENELSNLSI